MFSDSSLASLTLSSLTRDQQGYSAVDPFPQPYTASIASVNLLRGVQFELATL